MASQRASAGSSVVSRTSPDTTSHARTRDPHGGMTAMGVGGDVGVCRAVAGGVVGEVGDGPIKLVGIDGGHEVAGAMHADGPAVGGGPVLVRDAVQQWGDRDGYDRRPV